MQQQPTSSNVGQYGVINGLRGIASIGVLLHHSPFSGFARPMINTTTKTLHNMVPLFGVFWFLPFGFLSNGWSGVNLFFVLSAFVLYLPYAAGKRQMLCWDTANVRDSCKQTMLNAVQFWKRRAERLLPLYYFSLLVFVCFWRRGKQEREPNLVSWEFVKRMATMVTFTFPATEYMPYYYGAYWSIAIEVWFSVLFPPFVIVLELVQRLLSKCIPKHAALVAWLACYAILVVVFVPIRYVWIMSNKEVLPQPIVPTFLDEFTMGIIAAIIVVQYLVPISKIHINPLYATCAILFTMCYWYMAYYLMDIYTIRNYSESKFYSHHIPLLVRIIAHPLVRAISNTILDLAYLLAIASLITIPRDPAAVQQAHGTVARIWSQILHFAFANPILQWSGMMCYSIYIWHGHIAEYVFALGDSLWHAGLFLVLTYAMSIMSYRYIEFSSQSWKRLFFAIPK